MNPLAQLKKGTTVLAVLSALERGDIYGYGIRRETFLKTKGLFALNEGALYPLLNGMQRKGWVSAHRVKVKGRWRKYYRLTKRGRQALAESRAEWKHLLKALDAVLR